MYPELTVPLLVLVAFLLGLTGAIALRGTVARRFALRQVRRRPGQAALVVAGAAVGTAIVVSSLAVGDILHASVAKTADDRLGPVDELVTAPDRHGDEVMRRLAVLSGDPHIDGILAARRAEAGVAHGAGGARRAEPRATVWELDFVTGGQFAGGGSGLEGPTPGRGQAVLNADLAAALDAQTGDVLTVYLPGRAMPVRVMRVLPTRGIAGLQVGDAGGRNIFVSPGTLATADRVTLVSNLGGLEEGAELSRTVAAKLTAALGPLADQGVTVEEAKRELLDEARGTASYATSLLLSLGGFALVAGVLLVATIFGMLAEARKQELGMLRAIGMPRRWLVGGLIIEGAIEALVASMLGVGLGLGVARLIAGMAARRFAGVEVPAVVFEFRPATLLNGLALGFLIAFVTVLLTSIRIGRLNTVAALRDLPAAGGRRLPRHWVLLSTLAAATLVVVSAVAGPGDQVVGTYLLPSLAVLMLCPLLVRMVGRRWAYTAAAVAVLAWVGAGIALQPAAYDETSAGSIVVLGVLLVVAGVVLIDQHQALIARGFWPLLASPPATRFASRLALVYPVAQRARTGAILVMYALVVFTLVLISVFAHLVAAAVDRELVDDFGGFVLRADFRPSERLADPTSGFTSGRLAGRVRAVAPLTVADAELDAGTGDGAQAVTVVGGTRTLAEAGLFPLQERLGRLGDDKDVWRRVLTGDDYVLLTPALDAEPGAAVRLLDPVNGRSVRKTVAGVLRSGLALQGLGESDPAMIMSTAAARTAFGPRARVTAAFVQPAAGVSDDALAADLQGDFLAEGLVVSVNAPDHVRQDAAANRSFFQLLQGFLAAGLAIGIIGLSVMMVRAVRERRRDIGVLRAIGARARTVRWAFLGEGSWVAAEGTMLGTTLALAISYRVFQQQPELQRAGIPFSVPWPTIVAIVLAVVAASVLATAWPAWRASRIPPAVALRAE